MSASDYTHQTVLLHEAVDALVHDANGRYIDGTFGRGGHTRLILERLSPQGRLTAFDRDAQAIAAASAIADARLTMLHAPFSAIADLPAGSADGVLLDLGISSPQIDDPERGFSFRHSGPLDMRMDPSSGQSLADWLLTAQAPELERIIRDYGEERFAKNIAKTIVARIAAQGRINTTQELASLVASIVKSRDGAQHPATRTFQALRIFINAELEQLQLALQACMQVLKTDGRLVVISFHSLEDRIVKQFMAAQAREAFDREDAMWMLRQEGREMPLRLLGRSKPSAEEIARNPRSRSAVMRVAERTAANFEAGV